VFVQYYDELMYEAIGLGRGRGGELRRRLAPENEKDEREVVTCLDLYH
jgi:hypothetical protein